MANLKKYFSILVLVQIFLSYAPAAYAQTTTPYDYRTAGVSTQIEQYLCAPTAVTQSQTNTINGALTMGQTGFQANAAANNANGADLYKCINQLYKFAIISATVLGVFFLVIAGYIYMSDAGNGEGVTKGKNILETTITALVILFGGYLLLQTLNPDLVQFHSVQPPSVTLGPAGPTPGGSVNPTPVGGNTPPGPAVPGAACGNSGPPLCSGGTTDSSCTSTCNNYKSQIQQAIQIGGISISNADSAALIQAVMSNETGCSFKTSSAGACGLMQLIPSTASTYASQCGAGSATITCAWLNDPANAVASICMGGKYLQSLAGGICGNNTENIIAGYNGGSGGSKPGACTATADCAGYNSCGGGAMEAWECPYSDTGHTSCDTGYAATRSYVPKVMSCYTQLGGY